MTEETTIPLGVCQCGCGEPTKVSKVNHTVHGYVKGRPIRFVSPAHALRLRPPGKSDPSKRYPMVSVPGDWVIEHVWKASNALGKSLPAGVQVHHVNGDRRDNRNCNLVVCEDGAYHALLHVRTRALDACGNANWRKCSFCKAWDDPANLTISGKNASHRRCRAAYLRRRYHDARTGGVVS